MGRDDQPTEETGLGVRSTVHVLGHPIHPVLIPFPIAFLVGAAVTDVVFVLSDRAFWAEASAWLLIAGLLTGVAAASVGLVDFVTISQARCHRSGWVHLVGNLVVLVVALVNWISRGGDPSSFVEPWGLTLSLVTAILLGVTGWTGGELSYRHRIGVSGS